MAMRKSFIEEKYGVRKRAGIPDGFDRDSFETPPKLFRWLNKKYKFKMDLAANNSNALCEEFYTEADDTLNRPWLRSGYLFLNPPFSEMKYWIRKCQHEADAGCRIVVVANSNTTYTGYYNKRPAEHEYKIVGRISFCVGGVPIEGNAHHQAILVFNKKLRPLKGVWFRKDIMGEK